MRQAQHRAVYALLDVLSTDDLETPATCHACGQLTNRPGPWFLFDAYGVLCVYCGDECIRRYLTAHADDIPF
jgi:hypothetical protein